MPQISDEVQAAAREIYRGWLLAGSPEDRLLTIRQVAQWLGVQGHRVKVLRAARDRIDQREARRLGVDEAPYIPLTTALCRSHQGTTLYTARDVEDWVRYTGRRDPATGDIRHARPPGRPEIVAE